MVFNQEWREKLQSPLEFIIYKNTHTGLYSVRVYRGDAVEHMLVIRDYYGNIIYSELMGVNGEIDLFFLSCGIYIVELHNDIAVRSQVLRIR
jgi:hypothetical protein